MSRPAPDVEVAGEALKDPLVAEFLGLPEENPTVGILLTSEKVDHALGGGVAFSLSSHQKNKLASLIAQPFEGVVKYLHEGGVWPRNGPTPFKIKDNRHYEME